MDKPKRPKYGGRQPGTPNKATKDFRDTITALLSDNADNVAMWLAQVANGIAEDKELGIKGVAAAPEKALDLLAKLAEFAAPKLNRTELNHTGELTVRSAADLKDDELAAIATSSSK